MKRSAADEQHPDDNFRKGFSDKLKHYQAAPDRDVWSRIELSLDKQEAGIYKKRYKLFSQLAAACLLLLLSVGGFLGYRQWNNAAQTNSVATTVTQKNAPSAENQRFGTNGTETAEPAARNSAPQIADTDVASETAEPATPEQTNAEAPERELLANATVQEPIATRHPEIAANKTRKSGSRETNGFAKTAPEIAAITSRQAPKTTVPASAEPTLSDQSATLSAAETTRQQSAIAWQEPAEPTEENARQSAVKTAAPVASGTTLAADQEILAHKTPTVSEPSKEPIAVKAASGTNPETQTILASKPPVPDSSRTASVLIAQEAAAKPDSLIIAPKTLAGKQLSRWSVGATYGIQHFAQNLALTEAAFPQRPPSNANPTLVGQQQDMTRAAVEEFNQETSSAYSWQGGLEVGYELNRNWKILSGIRYTSNQAVSRTSYQIQPSPYGRPIYTTNQDFRGEPVLLAAMNAAEGDSNMIAVLVPQTLTYYQYRYLGLPVQIQYNFGEGEKLKSFVALGGVLNRVIYNNLGLPTGSGNKGIVVMNSTQTGNLEVMRGWQVVGTAAAGLSFRLSPQWQVQTGAELNWYAHAMFQEGQFRGVEQTNPVNLGAKAGMAYTFSK